jgi:hypothetical protein
MKFTERAALFEQLDAALLQEAAYVQNASGGDAVKIQSAGLDVRSPAQPVTALQAPQNLQAQFADNEGEVKTSWDSVLGASSYVVECATNPNGPWTQVVITTRTTHTLSGLTSGTKYWVRVRAGGVVGYGPWSDPVVKMAA